MLVSSIDLQNALRGSARLLCVTTLNCSLLVSRLCQLTKAREGGLPYKKEGGACRTFQWLKKQLGISQSVQLQKANRGSFHSTFQVIEPKKIICFVLEVELLRSEKNSKSQNRILISQGFFPQYSTSSPVLFIWESPLPGQEPPVCSLVKHLHNHDGDADGNVD